MDEAVTKLNGHTPAGPLSGGKYSAFEAGTRVPLIISWPGTITPQVSDALVCQIDFIHSFSKLLKQPLADREAPDSYDVLNALLGKTKTARDVLVQQGGALSIVKGDWKYIDPNNGIAYYKLTDTETGNLSSPQLYNLKNDIGEKNNVAEKYPEKVKELAAQLQKIRTGGRSRK